MRRPRSPHAWILTLLAALMLALPAAAPAQQPAGNGDGEEILAPLPVRARDGNVLLRDLRFLVRFLDLTEEQVQATRDLLQKFRQDLAPLREELRSLSGQLRSALGSDAPNPTEVGEIVIRLHGKRGEAAEMRRQLLEDFTALLTPEQQERFRALRQALDERRGRRGRRP